jgi:predicted Zn finger-like uncharacterized protein
MPAELVSCPECQRKLRVPPELIGKLVKCPTCSHTFTADLTRHAAPPEPESAPVAVERPLRTSKVGGDEEEDRSRRRPRREDDDDDDRPRRRSRSQRDDDYDDEDDDDWRRRRRRDAAPHRGGAVLTLGILGLCLSVIHVVPLAGLVCGIIAWVMGNTDLAEMRAGRMDREGESQTNAGRICGIIAVVLHIAALVIVAGIFMCFCVGAGAAAGRR